MKKKDETMHLASQPSLAAASDESGSCRTDVLSPDEEALFDAFASRAAALPPANDEQDELSPDEEALFDAFAGRAAKLPLTIEEKVALLRRVQESAHDLFADMADESDRHAPECIDEDFAQDLMPAPPTVRGADLGSQSAELTTRRCDASLFMDELDAGTWLVGDAGLTADAHRLGPVNRKLVGIG